MVNLFKKTISSVAAAAVVLTTSAATVQAGNSYGDVPANAWFAPYVSALADAKVFDGSKSSFRPAATMNRAEFVKTLVSAAGISTSDVESAGFSDVNSSDWFAPYVNAAVKAGFIDAPMASKGNKFFPNNNISRAAAAKIALGAFEINTADYQSPAAPFTDMDGHWGKEFVTAAYNLSIVDGKSATSFAPNDSIVRAAVAKVAAYTVIASADPATHVRFEDGTSAFSVYTSENVTEKVSAIVNSTEESATDEEMNNEEEETTQEEATTTPVVSDGSLEISLSSDSPKGAVLPAAVAGVEVAKYDITSNGDDVLLTSILVERSGIGNKDDFDNIVIFDESGRVSKIKGFNSDDEATITFNNGGLQIEAGETKTISVIAELGSTTAGNRSSVMIKSATSISSNATEVVGDFPVAGSTFEMGSVTGATLTIATDGTVADVKLGDENDEVMAFKVTNGNTEDVDFNGITLKEIDSIDEKTELANLAIYHDGIKLASVASMSDKYVTFTFDNSVEIKEGKTEKFSVKADIIGGANDDIYFVVAEKLDVSATGQKYGYGAGITLSGTINEDNATIGGAEANDVDVEAGKVTIVDIDAESDKVRKDKDNVVLGKIKITPNAGKNLEFEKVVVRIQQTATLTAGTGVTAFLENVELYDESKGTTYDLSNDATNTEDTDVNFTETDLGVALSDGETRTFAIRADTIDTTNINGAKFEVSIAGIGSTGIKIKETDDDTYVSDITPASISFKAIDGQTSSATVTALSLSSDKTAVVGTDDVVAMDFEVEADETSALKMTEVTFQATGTFESANTSEVKLWKKEGTNETLIATEGGSQISGNKITFDNLNVAIAADEKVRFVVTVSLVDDATNSAETIALAIDSDGTNLEVTLEDDDSDDVNVSGASDLASGRTITLTDKGTLSTFAVDNSDSEINDKNMNVLANTTTDFVASFEMKATNEPVKIKDLTITASADIKDYVSEMMIYDNDKTTLLATESVNAAATAFNNINFVVPESTTNVYVKLKMEKIGKDFTSQETSSAFTLRMKVTDAEGDNSGDTVVVNSGNNTSASKSIDVVATKVSNVELVNSYNGVTVTEDLDNGSQVIAIVKVTADSTTNTSTGGSAIKAVLQTVDFDLTTSNGSGSEVLSITSASLEKIGGNGSSATATSTGTDIAFDATALKTITSDIEVEGDAYYKVTAVVSNLYTGSNDPSGYLDIDMDDLNASNVVFKSCTDYNCTETAKNAANVTALNFKNKTSIDTPQISQVK